MSDNHHRRDARIAAIPDTHGHAKGEHKPYAEERPIPYSARMLFLWFYHACRRGYPRFMMVADHMNYLTFEDPAAVNLVRRALKLAEAGDLYGAAETANVEVAHAAAVSEGLRRGMRFSIGAEVDNDPRSRPDAQNIVDAMRPDAMIRSVHFIQIEHPTAGAEYVWGFDNPEFVSLFEHVGAERTWELYVQALLRSIAELPGHIVGHFYVPAVFGHWPPRAALEQYEDQVVEAARAKNMAIEFNTRFLYREHAAEDKQRYLEANKRLMRKCRDAGVLIAVGSDAHSPKDQGAAFDVVLQALDEIKVNEIAFPLGGRLARVALRVVAPPKPPPVPARAEAEKRPARAVAARAIRTTPSPARAAASTPAAAAKKPAPAVKSAKPAKSSVKGAAKKPLAKAAPPKRKAAAKSAPPKRAKSPAKSRARPAAKKSAKRAPVAKGKRPAKARMKSGGKAKSVAKKSSAKHKPAKKAAGKRR
ncbi:MAG: hypothetical protein JO101_02865 [Candidatus Eremiobacteraeota bacterium]|nr:hypothetical protein [Candidatus Eremiobacteraeota bacterium]